MLLFHTHRKIPAKRLILVGLGKTHELGLDQLRQAMGHAVKRVRHAKCSAFTVALPSALPHEASPIDMSQTMAEGAILGSYQFTTYRSDISAGKDLTAMTILAPSERSADLIVRRDPPRCHDCRSDSLRSGSLQSSVKRHDTDQDCSRGKDRREGNRCKSEILEQKEMEKLGMGALLGARKAATNHRSSLFSNTMEPRKQTTAPSCSSVRRSPSTPVGSRSTGGEYGTDEGRHDRWS